MDRGIYETLECVEIAHLRARFDNNAWYLRICYIPILELLITYHGDIARGSESVAAAIPCRATGSNVTRRTAELMASWRIMVKEAQPAISDSDFADL